MGSQWPMLGITFSLKSPTGGRQGNRIRSDISSRLLRRFLFE